MLQLTVATGLLAAAAAVQANRAPQRSARFGEGSQHHLGDPDFGRRGERQPNIVFVLTDDQDLHLGSLDYMPLVKKHLVDDGTLFKRHFCTTAVCCPSRVTLWTGKLAHNTNVTDVNPPYGGYPKFLSQGFNEDYLPVWLQQAGYDTYYAGKLFNAHTVDNYDKPFPGGWTHSDFLLDPYTYRYLNATYQRDRDRPVSYEGQHTTDVLASKALGFLDDAAAASGRPFFLGIAPIAPHSNFEFPTDQGGRLMSTAPVPAERHAQLFPDARVPRTPGFNPEQPSGASWVRRLARLDAHGLSGDTYVFFSADNGYHIGQHRLQPGKQCGYDEDVNVPLVVRGPGVPRGRVEHGLVTAHADLAPTILEIARAPARADLDGTAIPLTGEGLDDARRSRREHAAVEFWGIAAGEGEFPLSLEGEDGQGGRGTMVNNTYKAARLIGESYNLYYSVWCSGEHELYDLTTDPYQLNNLVLLSQTPHQHGPRRQPQSITVDGAAADVDRLATRLDALLLVLKSCKAATCVDPWRALHPPGDVSSLQDALHPRFDDFYQAEQQRVSFSRCEAGHIVEAEGPQFERERAVYRRDGLPWHEWV